MEKCGYTIRILQPAMSLVLPMSDKEESRGKEIDLVERKGIQSRIYQKLLFLCYKKEETLLRKTERNK